MVTGIRTIDLQHQELIDMINDLDDAIAEGRQTAAIDDVLPRLTAYVLFHFSFEESLMKDAETAHDHFAAHAEQHRLFGARIAELRAHPETSGDIGALASYLKMWLVEHIMRTDRELATLLAAQAVPPPVPLPAG